MLVADHKFIVPQEYLLNRIMFFGIEMEKYSK
jgi:hypothetical protein